MQLPSGFTFSGLACGIKASGKPDLALIVVDSLGVAAGVYTKNQVVAAPVLLCRRRTPGPIRALIVNSGNANACTGEQGMRDAEQMLDLVSEELSCQADHVLVMSTGVIGQRLPMPRIEVGIPQVCQALTAGDEAFAAAANAILTTDQGPKTTSTAFRTNAGDECRLAAMAKGAGMIGPNMATMLAAFLTDLDVEPQTLQNILQRVADQTFNCISVEGHTSTNDSMVLMSSRVVPATGADLETFESHLLSTATELAKMIPADGEGASHLIEIRVLGAASDREARAIANTIADSALVKTAFTGNDPNWGRIVSAAGYADATIDVARTSLRILQSVIFADGAPVAFDAATLSQQMADNFEIPIELSVGSGDGSARLWTSDLTVDYVRFNSDYTT